MSDPEVRPISTPAQHKVMAEKLLARSARMLAEAENPDTGSVKRPLLYDHARAIDAHALVHATLALFKAEHNVRSI